MRDGLRLYELDAVNLDTFRNNGYAGKEISKFRFNDVYAEHYIKIIANSDTVSLRDGDNIVIDNAELPNIHGNGYGPITSHASHGCSQRSYFTFANITMQTIKGEKFPNVLDNYNFESDNSRYVISLSDTAIEDLDDEEVLNDVAQKIVDKNITFIGLGDENSSEQYQQIVQLIPDNAFFYEYSDDTAISTIKNNIIDTEESKRILDSDAVVATNLTMDKIALPVIGSDGKITNQVSTDKATYYEHENVSIFDRIHNNSDIRAAKGLTNVISIIDTVGIEKFQVTTIDRYSKLYGQALFLGECLLFLSESY